MDPEKQINNRLPMLAGEVLPRLRQHCVDLFNRINWQRTDAEQPENLAADYEGAGARDWKRPAMVGYLVIILTFGVLGGWSAFARLDSAVVAQGVVTLESSRKTIQHFEGGIIAKILVQEGQRVEQGQLLFLLDNTLPQANVDAARGQLYTYLAQEARLIAERDGANQVTYPDELMSDLTRAVVRNAISDQNKQFAERRASLEGQVAILDSRIKQFATQIDGIKVEKAATEKQLEFINTELTDLRGLLEKNLVQKTRVLAMDREKARLEGVIGHADADIAKTENDIGEAHLQIDELHKKFSEDVNAQIVDVRAKIAELRQKLVVSQDVLHRIQIRAPRSGTIQALHVATVGGVIRPGEALAELIPDDDGLVVNAMVPPSDVDAIEAGMQAEVRFNAFHGYVLPIIMGNIESVSRDRLIDEQTKQPYFLARVVVDKSHVPTMVKDHIMAGMPAEVIVPTGERTVISYLVRPLRNRASGALREK